MKNVAIAAAVSMFTQTMILAPANAGQTDVFDTQLQLARANATPPAIAVFEPVSKRDFQGWQVAGCGGLSFVSSC